MMPRAHVKLVRVSRGDESIASVQPALAEAVIRSWLHHAGTLSDEPVLAATDFTNTPQYQPTGTAKQGVSPRDIPKPGAPD